jgi:hypothetical protein
MGLATRLARKCCPTMPLPTTINVCFTLIDNPDSDVLLFEVLKQWLCHDEQHYDFKALLNHYAENKASL